MSVYSIVFLTIYGLGLIFILSIIITNLVSGELKGEPFLNVLGVGLLMFIFSPILLLAFIGHVIKLIVTMPRKK